MLATPLCCEQLLEIFKSGEKEGFRVTGATALSHIVRANPNLFDLILDSLAMPDLCRTLTEENSRVQQAFITMVNIALLHKNEGLIYMMNEHSQLVKDTLSKLLEHQSLVI